MDLDKNVEYRSYLRLNIPSTSQVPTEYILVKYRIQLMYILSRYYVNSGYIFDEKQVNLKSILRKHIQ